MRRTGKRAPASYSTSKVCSAYPMQHVANHRPMRLLGPRLASENPVIVKRLDRAVLTLEIDPGSEEACKFLVTPRHGVGEREANCQRVRYRDRESWVEQREIRAPFRGKNQSVNALTASGEEIGGTIHRYRHDFHVRELAVHDLLDIRQVGNSDPKSGSSANPLRAGEIGAAIVRDHEAQGLINVRHGENHFPCAPRRDRDAAHDNVTQTGVDDFGQPGARYRYKLDCQSQLRRQGVSHFNIETHQLASCVEVAIRHRGIDKAHADAPASPN